MARRVPGPGVAGLLLTGGESRRMGVSKADLRIDGERLADRNAHALARVCDPVLEVGPGHTVLESVVEEPPGAGPLAAVVAGADALRTRGHRGAVLVLAVDVARVDLGLLTLLVERASGGALVPVAAGRLQPLCAVYGADALDVAGALVAAGERSMRALLAAVPVTEVREAAWRSVAPAGVLDDVDTAADAARLGVEMPE